MSNTHDITEEELLQMRQALGNFWDESGAFLSRQPDDPEKTSPAAQEIATFSRSLSIENIFSMTHMLIAVAADELQAFARITEPPVQTKAPFTCIRSCLESSALAAWLLDPSISADERVKRSMAYLFEGLSQEKKFAQISHIIVTPDVERIEKSLDDLENEGNQLGFQRLSDRNGKRIGVGVQFPGMTDLIGEQFNEERTYRLLSAMAHSHAWALMPLSFSEVQNPNTPQPKTGHRFVEQSLSALAWRFLSHKALKAFTTIIWRKCHYFGWDIAGLEAIFDKAFDELKIAERFWRPSKPANS